MKLDLLLNANCYGAEAMSRKLEDHVRDILAELDDWNCRPEIVTTASPFVARTLKELAPDIEVRASVNMRTAWRRDGNAIIGFFRAKADKG